MKYLIFNNETFTVILDYWSLKVLWDVIPTFINVSHSPNIYLLKGSYSLGSFTLCLGPNWLPNIQLYIASFFIDVAVCTCAKREKHVLCAWEKQLVDDFLLLPLCAYLSIRFLLHLWLTNHHHFFFFCGWE